MMRKKWVFKSIIDNPEEFIQDEVTGYRKPPFDSEKILKEIKVVVDKYFKDNPEAEEDINILICQQITKEIRDSLKSWSNLRRYRIVALATLVEKKDQGVSYKMKNVMDPKTDNLVKFYYDNPRFYLIICVVLVYLD